MRSVRFRKWLLGLTMGTTFALTGAGPGCVEGRDIQEIFVVAGNELVQDFFKSMINAVIRGVFPEFGSSTST